MSTNQKKCTRCKIVKAISKFAFQKKKNSKLRKNVCNRCNYLKRIANLIVRKPIDKRKKIKCIKCLKTKDAKCFGFTYKCKLRYNTCEKCKTLQRNPREKIKMRKYYTTSNKKQIKNLSDNYILGCMCKGKKHLRPIFKSNLNLIEAIRQNIKLKRKTNGK